MYETPNTKFVFRICAALILTSFLRHQLFSQPLEVRYSPLGDMILLHLSSSPFPHPLRADGHVYGGQTYPAEVHYRDSTVGVFIPRAFRKDLPFDLVVHIHGWHNNVDSVFAQFAVAEQLVESGRNAVLVAPQGPKNAPDSFGGRLEEKDAFKTFISEILWSLASRK